MISKPLGAGGVFADCLWSQNGRLLVARPVTRQGRSQLVVLSLSADLSDKVTLWEQPIAEKGAWPRMTRDAQGVVWIGWRSRGLWLSRGFEAPEKIARSLFGMSPLCLGEGEIAWQQPDRKIRCRRLDGNGIEILPLLAKATGLSRILPGPVIRRCVDDRIDWGTNPCFDPTGAVVAQDRSDHGLIVRAFGGEQQIWTNQKRLNPRIAVSLDGQRIAVVAWAPDLPLRVAVLSDEDFR